MSETSGEKLNIEYKQEYVSDIKKEVIAFANAEGGTVFVGICNDGAVKGVDDPDEVMLRIVNSLKDAIAPDVMPFVRVDRKSTRLNSSHTAESRMPSSA